MNKHYDVIVIGSGPAGLSAAYAAASRGKRVAVLERNDIPARKIYATGNGRCNFANEVDPHIDEILGHAKKIGLVYTKEEDRYYPRNLQASSAAEILVSAAKKAGAEIMTSFCVSSVQKSVQGFAVESDKGVSLNSDKLIIACGGKAGIQLGCMGDGYRWAQAFGLKLVKPIPALTGLVPSESTEEIHGVRTGARVAMLCNGELIASDCGEVQFTKSGISGICVMNLSRYFRIGEGKKYSLSLDLFPEYTEDELKKLLASQHAATGNPLAGLLPDKLCKYIRLRCEKYSAGELARVLKNLCFNIESAKGWKDAQVSCGGVALSELTEGFEAKAAPGLFFAGEVVDYDGPCGGFNIGFAIRSGLAAGEEAVK